MGFTLITNQADTKNSVALNVLSKSADKEPSSVLLDEKDNNAQDFLAIMLSEAFKKEQSTNDLKELPTIQEQFTKEIEELDDTLLLKEATFIELLQFLENMNKQIALHSNSEEIQFKFPNFSDKLDSLFKDASVFEEFKNAKSLKDILALSKKYDLGLEKISISQKDLKQLETTFPNLTKNDFFQPKKTIISSEMLLKSSKKPTLKPDKNPIDKQGETSTLSKLLQNIEDRKNVKMKKIHPSETDNSVKNSDEKISKNTSQMDLFSKINKIRQNNSSAIQETPLTTQTKQEKNINNPILNVSNKILHQNTSEESSQPPIETPEVDKNVNILKDAKNIHTFKNQNIDVKQTLNTFARDFKEQIEQYKPPLMKVQLALNPKHLGEMEVTIINRGSNLHVNFASNTNAMNLFIQNQAEFKNSLVNMGFTNLEMNFSDERNQKEHKKGNYSFESKDEFDEFDEFVDEKTIVNMVIPHYV